MSELDQKTIEERLWAIVNELCSTNEYEYPYRIPALQKEADKILKDISEQAKDGEHGST